MLFYIPDGLLPSVFGSLECRVHDDIFICRTPVGVRRHFAPERMFHRLLFHDDHSVTIECKNVEVYMRLFIHMLDNLTKAEFTLIIFSGNRISRGSSKISGKHLHGYWELPWRHEYSTLTKMCGNISASVTSNNWFLWTPGSIVGKILPIEIVCLISGGNVF